MVTIQGRLYGNGAKIPAEGSVGKAIASFLKNGGGGSVAYKYKMVQIPPTIVVKGREYQGQEAAHYLESLVNEMAAQGWEFYRVDTIGVLTKPGCLGQLFGAREIMREYYVVTFRRET
jgi:hypothetical protein